MHDYNGDMDDKVFKAICVDVGTGARLLDAIGSRDVGIDTWILYLAESAQAQEYLHLMQGLAVDLVLDKIAFMLEHEIDLARVKALRDFWLVLAEKHAPEKYGKKTKIELGIRHEEVLEQLLLLDDSPDIQIPTFGNQIPTFGVATNKPMEIIND